MCCARGGGNGWCGGVLRGAGSAGGRESKEGGAYRQRGIVQFSNWLRHGRGERGAGPEEKKHTYDGKGRAGGGCRVFLVRRASRRV